MGRVPGGFLEDSCSTVCTKVLPGGVVKIPEGDRACFRHLVLWGLRSQGEGWVFGGMWTHGPVRAFVAFRAVGPSVPSGRVGCGVKATHGHRGHASSPSRWYYFSTV